IYFVYTLLAEHWETLGRERLAGIVSISSDAGENKIYGDVLGKKFSLRYAAFAMEGDGALEAVLTTQDLVTGKDVELSRFLVSGEGDILSMSGEKILEIEYRDTPLKSLFAIVKYVMG
ncbi:hypothetical protein, partial [Pseudomonas syringae group genomosp. 3]